MRTVSNREPEPFRSVAVAAAPVSPTLLAVAHSQITGAAGDGDGLLIRGAGREAMLRAALQLRRWSHSGNDGGVPTSVAVAGGTTPERAVERAREIAGTAPADAVHAQPGLLPSHHAWLSGSPSTNGDEAVRWAGPGTGRAIDLPLPGPVAVALDRPCAMLGRDHELDLIARGWARATAGHGSLTLIAGDPGAGKSRLAAEAAREIHEAGGLVLFGSGEDPVGAPYAPFARAIGEAVRHGPDEFATRLRASPIGRATLGEGDERRPPEGRLGDERGELFSSAIEGLDRLGEHQPVLIVLEDLHAFGSASLELLDRLAQAAPSLALMILATYRPTDLDPAEADAGAIAELGSRPDTVQIELAALPNRALEGIAAALDPGAERAELESTARAVRRDTDGNPLYAIELLRSGLGGSEDATPRPLRLLIVSRTRGLGVAALEHLSAAAVAGRRFDPAVIAQALAITQEQMLDSVARGERAGLLTVDPGGGCTFTHAITARSLSDEIGAAGRAVLHGRIAEAIEELYGDGADPALLADHWERAGSGNEARAAALWARAGRRALEAYDHERAATCFERALTLHGRVGDDRLGRCDLLIGLGRARRFSGGGEYREILLEAARLADELGDPSRLAEAALANHRGFVSLVGGLDRERLAVLERAAELIDEPGAERCLVLAQLALERTFSADLEVRRELADDALEIARSLGDERILARVLIRHLIACWGPDDPRERIAEAAESLAISSGLGEQLDLFHGLHWRAAAQIEVGEVPAAAAGLLEAAPIADRVGDPTARWLKECGRSLVHTIHGELEAGESAATRAFELAQASGQPDAISFYATAIAAIRWQQGRLPELLPLLVQALDENPGLPAFRSLVALSAVLAGDRDRARAELATAAADDFALPSDPVWLAAITTWAHAAAELGDREAAAILHPRLAPYRNRLASTSVSCWGHVGHALGRLELVLGETGRGRRSLEASIEVYERIAAPVWRVHAAIDLLAALGEGAVRREPAGGRWIAEAERIAASGSAALPLLKAQRISAGAAALALDRRIAELGLTERQADVVRLLATGRSNAEIAAELQISTSTVKRHVENVYRRTGAQGRGALTATLLGPD